MLEISPPGSPAPPSAHDASTPSSARTLAQEVARRVAAGSAGSARVRHADGSYGCLLIAELLAGPWAEVPRPLLVVVPDDDVARQTAADLAFFLSDPEILDPGAALLARPRVDVLGAIDVSPFGGLNPDRATQQARMATLFRLSQGLSGEVVVAPASALLRRVVPRPSFEDRCEVLVPASTVDREGLIGRLAAGGYARMPVCDDPGTFAVRGGVVDVFPPLYRFPVRIELDGDEIDSIKLYDPGSQRSLRSIPELYLHPARESVPLEADTAVAYRRARDRALDLGDAQGIPSTKVNALADDLGGGRDFYGREALAPLLHERMGTVFDYLPVGTHLVVVDPVGVASAAADEEVRHQELHATRHAAGEVVVSPSDWFLEASQLGEELARRRRLELVDLSLDLETAPGADLVAGPRPHAELGNETRRVRLERGQELLKPLANALRSWLQQGFRAVVTTRTGPQAERLSALLRGHALPVAQAVTTWPLGSQIEHAQRSAADRPQVEIRRGEVARGFVSVADRLAVVAEEEIFGTRGRRKVRDPGAALAAAEAATAADGETGDAAADAGDGGPAATAAPAGPSTSSARRYAQFISTLGELKPGDLVVHTEHGIGRYTGLVTLEIPVAAPVGGDVTARSFAQRRTMRADFLHLEYGEGAKLYLPVYRLNLVEKYVGGGESTLAPRLDKLGGQTWDKTRKKVSQAVKQMADELLRLYAERQLAQGFAFPSEAELGSIWSEFEATFPFEETADQKRAIDEVLADMEQGRPMDRLVCGDVGYGKTEVAIRAAFRAVLGKKQVAVLAPTTVLVEQHAVTFAERFKDFPVNVAALSRFQQRKEQTEVIKRIREGKVDVVIGTHRLLSSDLEFKDLGLMVIDEEQRFGVAHKERLKKLRTEIDVLTMSATPIPRTLHMAMMGSRDLSIITTPPADRVAIRTFVTRDSDTTLKEAIEKELARGGQVFFVVPRIVEGASNEAPDEKSSLPPDPTAAPVKRRRASAGMGKSSIGETAERIRKLVPRAKIGVAHGQMAESELEQAMVDFVDGKFDVLVCTTIVESGLDIPRANTMFVQRADAFGLAQLYQLRGRIGRGKERAYCYLLVPPEGTLSGDARARLSALERFTELGAGFQIASHDLELRGAGNLLGGEQSGHIALVGFEAYTRIMEEAVAELRGQEVIREPEPDLNLDVPGFIPDEYVEDTGQRLAFYQRLSRAALGTDGSAGDGGVEEAVERVLRELADRYGQAPDEVQQLGVIMVIKGLAGRLGALSVDVAADRLSLTLSQRTVLTPDRVIALINKKNSPYRLTQEMKLVRRLVAVDAMEKLQEVKKVLQELTPRGS